MLFQWLIAFCYREAPLHKLFSDIWNPWKFNLNFLRIIMKWLLQIIFKNYNKMILRNYWMIHWCQNKMIKMCLKQFQKHFCWQIRTFLSFGLHFHGIFLQPGNWQWLGVGLGTGLLPSKWQAIFWSNDDLIHLCMMYTSLGLTGYIYQLLALKCLFF